MILMAVAGGLLISCHTTENRGGSSVDAVSSATEKVTDVPYTVADHYFVRNDVKKLPNGKISSQKDFESKIGKAPVMGEGGLPTEIDFDKQFAISVTKPVTDYATDLEPVSLVSDSEGDLVFTYRTIVGEHQSYSIQPNLIIIVDKKYKGRVKIREEE